ncbi:DUF6192 family protein [Streptomyces griseoloalbus]|uniref:DUF6192 family protein n=1 Tax=Streptomyces griseoloalbus TaxID=67303 RepID=UPI0033B4E54D
MRTANGHGDRCAVAAEVTTGLLRRPGVALQAMGDDTARHQVNRAQVERGQQAREDFEENNPLVPAIRAIDRSVEFLGLVTACHAFVTAAGRVVPRASERRSAASQRHADTVRFVLFEARPAGLTFPQLVRSGELTLSQTRAGRAGLACLRDIISERGWPPLIWTKQDGYRFCTDIAELQANELSIVREKLTEIRRFITAVVGPYPALQPKGRWIKHRNTQLSSVESTLDVIAECIDT